MSVWQIDNYKAVGHSGRVQREQLYKEVGQKIALARDGKFTQLELARKIGMSRPALANIERGEQQIYVHQLLAIADALGFELAALLPSQAFTPIPKANVSVSGDRLNRAQERKIKELVTSITSASRRK